MITTFETHHLTPHGLKLGLLEGVAYDVRDMCPLGCGGYGTVYHVDIDTGIHDDHFALKSYPGMEYSETARSEWCTHVYVGDAHGHAALPYAFGVLTYASTSYKQPAYLMSLAEGKTLNAIVEELSDRGPLGVQTCAHIGYETAKGVSALHACGLSHRDLAPENIVAVYDPDTGKVIKLTVLDFGQAAVPTDILTPGGAFRIAHVNFGSPEEFQPAGVGFGDMRFRPSVDIWSIGALLYWMYTLTNPHEQEINAIKGRPDADFWNHVVEIKKPGLFLPPTLVGSRKPDLALSELIHDCTAFDPADRPSIDEVAARLSELSLTPARTYTSMLTPVRNA